MNQTRCRSYLIVISTLSLIALFQVFNHNNPGDDVKVSVYNNDIKDTFFQRMFVRRVTRATSIIAKTSQQQQQSREFPAKTAKTTDDGNTSSSAAAAVLTITSSVDSGDTKKTMGGEIEKDETNYNSKEESSGSSSSISSNTSSDNNSAIEKTKVEPINNNGNDADDRKEQEKSSSTITLNNEADKNTVDSSKTEELQEKLSSIWGSNSNNENELENSKVEEKGENDKKEEKNIAKVPIPSSTTTTKSSALSLSSSNKDGKEQKENISNNNHNDKTIEEEDSIEKSLNALQKQSALKATATITNENDNAMKQKQNEISLSSSSSSTNSDDKNNDTNNNQIRRPKIYTYADDEYTDSELLKIWIESWKNAGWETNVLNIENAQLHPKYNDFNKLLDGRNICCLGKQSFIRYLAMGTIKDDENNFFSEIYVLPLHKITSSTTTNILPEHGLTYHDGFTGSIISGSTNDFNLLIALLMSNIEKNSSISHRKIWDLSRGSSTSSDEELIAKIKNIFHYRNVEFLENIRYFNQDVCLRSEDKFFLRIHPNEIQKHNIGYLPSSFRAIMIKNWLSFYTNLCWKSHDLNNVVPKQISTASTHDNETKSDVEDEFDAKSYEKAIIHDGSTQTQVTCDAVSCHIQDACIGTKGVIQIFGDEEHVRTQQEKLANKITHAWVCEGCRREILTERGTSFHNIWADTATMSTGIDHNNCGFHLGDVIWPLVRLNAKFRDAQDIVNNDGLGYLFLESPASHCDSLYTAVSQQVTRYQSIQNNVCFNNIYVGAYQMNYMITSPNAFFAPYDNFHRDMRIMRSLFYSSFGIDTNNLPQLDTILIMRKRKGRKDFRNLLYHNIANIPQIVNMIKAKFPNKYNIQIVSWEDYSMMQQVRIMSRTKLIISLPGAATMNAFLFQDDATLLCYCQRDDNVSADSSTVFINNVKFQMSNEFKLWFDHFDYGHFHQICQEPDMGLMGSDTIVNVDVLEKRMLNLGM